LPVAHENDPAQAIRAGLAIQAEADKIAKELQIERGLVGFQVRVGISTGLVFSGGETEGEDTVKGEPVNLAKRLESAAQPGTVLISHDSYKHVRGLFGVKPLDSIEAKGFAEPVVVYRVKSHKPRSFYRGMRGVEGVETRMVGREPEFLQLQKTLVDVIEEQAGQMVTVVGAAGLGKSRLLYEFENWVDLRREQIWFYKGRARQESQNLPYGLLRSLFAFRFGIQDDDRTQEVREKLENGFGEVFGRTEEGQKKPHIIGQLLGYAFQDSPHLKGVLDHPQQLRDQAVMYIGGYFKSLAQRNPVLVLLEDLHWSDEASLDALNSLAFELTDHPVLILATARHSLLERRPHWGEGQDFYQCIQLRPLSKRECKNLVAEVLQKVKDVPDVLSELVMGNADGNPFYVEELVKMLVEDGIIIPGEPHWRVEAGRLEEVHVPPTLTGVLQARLDGLPEEERRALQGASVVGRVFWDQVLEYINGALEDRITERGIADVLDELRSRELIFQRETSAFAEAREHIFKHALLREVTYESVLKRVRQAYHALVAEWLIEHAGERAVEFTGLIADHLELAEKEREAGKFLVKAGKQAAEKFANEEAIGYLSRALALTAETDSETRYEILREREQVYDLIGDRDAQKADIVTMETLSNILADQSKQAETALRQAHLTNLVCDHPSSLQASQKAVRIARENGNLEQEAAGHLAWGTTLWRSWEPDDAKLKLDKAFELAQKTGNQQLVAHALRNLGVIAGILNDDFTMAIKYHQECLTLYRKIGDRIGEIIALINLGNYYSGQSDFEMALEYFEKTLALSREIGHKHLEGLALINLGENHIILGEYNQAWNEYEQSLKINRQLKNPAGITFGLWGFACIAVLDPEKYQIARKVSEEGITIAREAGMTHYEKAFVNFLAQSFMGINRWSEAEDQLEKSIAIPVKTDRQEIIIFTRECLARLYLAQGLLEKAVKQVNMVLEELVAYENREPYWLLLLPRHTCCQVLGAASDPRYPQVLETTFNHLNNLAEKIKSQNLQNSFLNNVPWNRGIIEMWEAKQEKKSKNHFIS
jgi:predicted ATPase